MNGRDYIAQGELYDKPRRMIVARPGDTCERVNPKSLGWLEAQGYIVKREQAPAEPVHPVTVSDQLLDNLGIPPAAATDDDAQEGA